MSRLCYADRGRSDKIKVRATILAPWRRTQRRHMVILCGGPWERHMANPDLGDWWSCLPICDQPLDSVWAHWGLASDKKRIPLAICRRLGSRPTCDPNGKTLVGHQSNQRGALGTAKVRARGPWGGQGHLIEQWRLGFLGKENHARDAHVRGHRSNWRQVHENNWLVHEVWGQCNFVGVLGRHFQHNWTLSRVWNSWDGVSTITSRRKRGEPY